MNGESYRLNRSRESDGLKLQTIARKNRAHGQRCLYLLPQPLHLTCLLPSVITPAVRDRPQWSNIPAPLMFSRSPVRIHLPLTAYGWRISNELMMLHPEGARLDEPRLDCHAHATCFENVPLHCLAVMVEPGTLEHSPPMAATRHASFSRLQLIALDQDQL